MPTVTEPPNGPSPEAPGSGQAPTGTADRKIIFWLILIGAVGLCLRLALALTITPVLHYDSLEYHQYAQHLVEEGRYYSEIWQAPTGTVTGEFYSLRAPGYVFFIAAVYKAFGVNDKMVSLIQAIMDFLSGLLVYLIARRWLGPGYSLFAYLGHQILVVYTPMLMSEALFMFLFLLSLWLTVGPRRSSWTATVINGLLWGWIILTRPEKVIFAPVFAGYVFWKNPTRRSAAQVLVWLALAAAVITPWLIREHQVHGRFVWMTTRGGMTLFDGSYLPISKRQVLAEGVSRRLDEGAMDRLFYQVAIDYLTAHPGHYFRTCFRRLGVLLNLKTYNGLGSFVIYPLLEPGGLFRRFLAFLTYYFFLASRMIMVLGLIGAVLSRRRFRELFLIYAIPLIIVLFHFGLFLGKPRYLVPAYPCLCIFFALGLEWVRRRWPGTGKDERRAKP